MRVFVLHAGRGGSTTFAMAARHFTNFTVAHGSTSGRINASRFEFPDDHIEIDSRLPWFLGSIPEDGPTKYVHLRQDTEKTAREFADRWEADPEAPVDLTGSKFVKMHPGGRILESFAYGVVQRSKPWPVRTRLDIARFYVDTVNDNITEFLRSRDAMVVDIEDCPQAFLDFASWIGAEGDLGAAVAEFPSKDHGNASTVVAESPTTPQPVVVVDATSAASTDDDGVDDDPPSPEPVTAAPGVTPASSPAAAGTATMPTPHTSFRPAAGLTRLGGLPGLRDYVTRVWERRQFAITNAMGEVRSQHLNTALGNVWHLLNPVLLITIYYVIFGLILDVTRGLENYIAFLSIGVFTYSWATKCVGSGASTIVTNEGLIRSLQFPRALLPMSAVMRETLAFLPSLVVMVAVVLLTGEPLTAAWLLILPVFLLQALFGVGVSFLGARAAANYRDVLNLLPYVFRIAFYSSGVLYAVDDRFHAAFENPWVVRLFVANPFYCFISLWRSALMSSVEVQHLPAIWGSAIAWAVLTVLIGITVIYRGESDYGRG